MRLFDKLIKKVEEEQKLADSKAAYADQIRHLSRARAFLEAARIVSDHLHEEV